MEYPAKGFFIVGPTNSWHDFIRMARYFVATCLVAVNSFIGLAVLVQKLRRPTQTPLKPSGLFVLNMLFADAFFGIIILALSKRPPLLDLYWCGLMAGAFYMSTVGSHISFINVNVDRFIAVVYYGRYVTLMTTRRSRMMVAGGWLLPVIGLVAGILSGSHTKPVARCSDIEGIRIFLTWFWIPTHVCTTLFLIAVQFRQCRQVRQYDVQERPRSNTANLRYSQRASQLLLYLTIPSSVLLFSYFSSVILVMTNKTLVSDPVLLHSILLLGVEISVLMNALLYSYETATIKKSIGNLFKDFNNWWRPTMDVKCDAQRSEVTRRGGK